MRPVKASSGLAAASKLTMLAPLAGWTVWLAAARRRPRDGAEFLAAATLVVGPWLLKTWTFWKAANWANGPPCWVRF